MDVLELTGDQLSATVATKGAEPQSLRVPGVGGPTELLWQAGEEWRRHAPVLFPVIGRVVDDEVVVDGEPYPMTQHGFARDTEFDVLEASRTRAVLRLEDDEETRRHFPFGFALTVTYEVRGSSFVTRYAVATRGGGPMPFSLGSHPAFRWPLVPGVAKDAHTVEFAAPEPAPVRRVEQTLLTPEQHPTPVDGRVLPLDEELFRADAVVMEHLASRSLQFSGPGTPVVRLDLDGLPHLGVWSKPTGADFLCLEPWAGLPSPAGEQTEYRDKPYQLVCAPGDVVELGYTVTVEPPQG